MKGVGPSPHKHDDLIEAATRGDPPPRDDLEAEDDKMKALTGPVRGSSGPRSVLFLVGRVCSFTS